MREQMYEEPFGKCTVLPPIIKRDSLLLGTVLLWYVSLAS
jgi:hypothetical protein